MRRRLLVATRKGLFTIHLDGMRATVKEPHFPGVPVAQVLCDPRDGTIYAALEHGHFGVKLHRSRDGGGTFEEIATPVYPEKPADCEDLDPWRKTPVPWSVIKIWELAASTAEDRGGLWCGTIPGGLFRSDDHGDSWHIIDSLWNDGRRRRWSGGGYDHPGIHSILVDPADASRLTIGVSCGGVWHSTDKGGSWNLIGKGQRADYLPPEQALDPGAQDPHRIVASAADPKRVWNQHHCGIFRSDDGAQHFTEITADAPSRFGFAVAVSPGDPDTAWFVPGHSDMQRIPVGGHFCVLRTDDAGQSFQILDHGLPRPAYDLVYRHALDVDQDHLLAFGSTTGSLWVGPDGGKTFHLVSAHLPPIHAVKIVRP